MMQNNQYNNKIGGVVFNNILFKKLLLVLLAITVVAGIFLIIFAINNKAPDDNISKAKAAARKEIPNAEVKQVVIADDFAKSIVYVPKDKSQLGSGNITYFRVNQDGSMTYIASASYFSPLDLLGFKIPLETQAKLNETSIQSVRQDLADVCSYNGGITPGFIGFDGSFSPGGWQIDQASLDGIKSALKNDLKVKNFGKAPVDRIVCINALLDGSNVITDKASNNSNFLIKLQFVNGNGLITSHDFMFSDGPVYSRTYTLDGQKIQIN